MKRTLVAIGTFFTALLTSLCPFCLVALIGLGTGFGSVLKPVFVFINIAMLVVLWYFTYRKPKSCSNEKGACGKATTSRKVIFWLVAIISLASHLYIWLFGVIEF